MYTATFYSFKGGVGRSMALANVAVELAKRGRRVLAVDFDLEAPGLDTFDVLRPRDEVPGIIDFVHQYLHSDQAPDVHEFMSRLPAVGDRDGELWIMPSGAQRATYAEHFNDIDWAELYEKRDGYLLFEDLKAQWEQAIDPDYVLIDSRTGHTDTGGICTRQLPDAVAILFFPNEQNLRGLTKIARDIRAEAGEPRRKDINLHFVMSNVPDLDDQDRILQTKIDSFREQLGFTGDPPDGAPLRQPRAAEPGGIHKGPSEESAGDRISASCSRDRWTQPGRSGWSTGLHQASRRAMAPSRDYARVAGRDEPETG